MNFNVFITIFILTFSIINNHNNNNNNNNNNIISDKEDDYLVPKIIWLYWEGPTNDFIRLCLHKLKNNIINYNLILLNNNTINCYFNSSDIPLILPSLPLPNQADYYRFQLLSQYGGIYMDVSSYIKNDKVLDELIEEMKEKKADILAFNFKYYPNNNIELGILLSSNNSSFIKKVLNIYVFGLKNGRIEMMKRMIRDGLVLNYSIHYKYNEKTGEEYYSYYFFSYYCVQYILQIIYNNNANIIIKKAEEYSYKFQNDYKWNGEEMRRVFLDEEKLNKYKLIKFTGKNRRAMNIIYNDII